MSNIKRKNSNKYFTGKPCKRGHIAERYKGNRTCVVCTNQNYTIVQRDRYRAMKNTLAKQFAKRKQRATREGIPFTIKLEDLEQPEYCPILGIKLNYGYGGPSSKLRDPAKATLDKVVPELGYIPGNVYVISWRANMLKSNMTLQEIEKIRKYIKEKTRGKTIRHQ